jgi:mannose-1-phosphate guanylyltransferase/phosphomannomutase
MKSAAVIGLFPTTNPTACGLVGADENGKIERFVEKPSAEEVFTDQANAGVYYLTSQVFKYIPKSGPCDFGKQVFPQMLAAGEPLYAVGIKGYLQDVGTPENYRKANEDVLKGKVFGLRGKLVSNDPNYTLIGDRAHLAPDVSFRGINIVGPRARVGARSALKDTIVWEDAKIPDDQKLDGVIIGAHVDIETGQNVAPGSLIAVQARSADEGYTVT